MHPVIIGLSRGFERPAKITRDGTFFKARNRPPAIQLRRTDQFMEFPIKEDHGPEIRPLLEEMVDQDARSAGSGIAGSAHVCKTERAQEIFNLLWEITRG